MAPWIARQLVSLLAQNGHAWLLQGPSGLGQYSLALALAQAWLCEQPTGQGACGQCASCHAVQVHTHADLCMLMPETELLAMGWPLSEKAQAEIDDKKRKASREIRVDAMREAIEFSQRTSARGRGKVVLVFPAENMNMVTANALLKTLEEPVGDVKFVLASASAHRLLPTIRSRCLMHTMDWPQHEAALAWLATHGIGPSDATHLLMASGGRPDDALAGAAQGLRADLWAQIPSAMLQGDCAPVRDWAAPLLVDCLQKLCHDVMVCKLGAEPRFFGKDVLQVASKAPFRSLSDWSTSLVAARKTMDHPFHAGLMQEALVSGAKTALNSAA